MKHLITIILITISTVSTLHLLMAKSENLRLKEDMYELQINRENLNYQLLQCKQLIRNQ